MENYNDEYLRLVCRVSKETPDERMFQIAQQETKKSEGQK